MLKGIRLLGDEISNQELHVRCIARFINMCVKTAFRKVSKCISCIRRITRAIKQPLKCRERFQKLKEGLNLENKLLPGLDVEQHWSKIYSMLERAITSK